MFIDHATNFIFHRHQANLTSAESLQSKHSLEAFSSDYGIKPQHYSSDNHPFTSKKWVVDCDNQHQLQSLSGVGAYHQNYMERHIQTIFNWARSSLLHFVFHWPQQAQENLWPFAIDYSIYLWNNMSSRDRIVSPTELLISTAFHNHYHLQCAHVFGCPVFVLDPRLQDSKKIPKWSMRSKQGIYLGLVHFTPLLPICWSLTQPRDPSLLDTILSSVTPFSLSFLMVNLIHPSRPICFPMDMSSVPLSNRI